MKLFYLFLLFPTLSFAEVRMPNLFSNHMVIQRDLPIRIWGWATPTEKVTVSFKDTKTSVQTDTNGKWRVELPAHKANFSPSDISIEGNNNQIVIKDVLVGDVWLCSGQSNMEWPLKQSQGGQEAIAAATNSNIRFLKIDDPLQANPSQNVKRKWMVCNPKTIGQFSGVGYFFGQKVAEEFDTPIGLISAALGGTLIEAWMTDDSFDKSEALRKFWDKTNTLNQKYKSSLAGNLAKLEKWVNETRVALTNNTPLPVEPRFPPAPMTKAYNATALFNARINPVVGYGIKGVLWYQGERNLKVDNDSYNEKLEGLAEGWRQAWNCGAFPFYYVQIPPGTFYPEGRLVKFWADQNEALAIPNSGMVVINDVGNLNNIHPKNKKDVGLRLANLALAKTYGFKDLIYYGPVFNGFKVKGNKIIVSFKSSGEGLKSRDDKPLSHFQVAAADGIFKDATATIKGNKVIVSSEEVPKPVTVRFGWHHLAVPNLVNSAGLPAFPFSGPDVILAF